MHNVNPLPLEKGFFLDFVYVIKMPTTIHLVYTCILLLLQFVLGATLLLLDYSGFQ